MIYTLIISLLIETVLFVESAKLFISNSVRVHRYFCKFSNFMSGGGAFDSLFCPEGRAFVHNVDPGGGFLLPSSRVPGGGKDGYG